MVPWRLTTGARARCCLRGDALTHRQPGAGTGRSRQFRHITVSGDIAFGIAATICQTRWGNESSFSIFLPEVIFQHNLEKRPSEAALRRNQHLARNGLQLAGAAVIMPCALVLNALNGGSVGSPATLSVYQVRSGRKQPRQMTRVPGVAGRAPTHFCLPPFRQKIPNG